MTKEQINKKYKNKYIEVLANFNYKTNKYDYEIINIYNNIHENTTLGQDLGTSKEYTR